MNPLQFAIAMETGLSGDVVKTVVEQVTAYQAVALRILLEKWEVDGDTKALIEGMIFILYNSSSPSMSE